MVDIGDGFDLDERLLSASRVMTLLRLPNRAMTRQPASTPSSRINLLTMQPPPIIVSNLPSPHHSAVTPLIAEIQEAEATLPPTTLSTASLTLSLDPVSLVLQSL